MHASSQNFSYLSWLAELMDCMLYRQIAASLKAEKLILMTDVPGVLRDKDDITTKFTALDIRQVRELVADGIIAGGMIPKCVPNRLSVAVGHWNCASIAPWLHG